ncbi:MAG: host attachment protein [Phenylobacterium sp.]
MMLPRNATVAVADGETLRLYRNGGDEARLHLTALPDPALETVNAGSGARHHSSSANPDDSQVAEDSFAAASAAWLNRRVLEGSIEALMVIAAPRTLGELRKHYRKELQAVLVGELSKDLAGHPVADVEHAVANA